MRGYPKGPLSKQDFENLLNMPEHAKRAKAGLTTLASMDDDKIIVDRGTEAAPVLVPIDNPQPAWKRAGFARKLDLARMATIEEKPNEKELKKK
jgi:hypothetical protein